ncbi:serine hydroxymethyltransferase, partial [Candidatus Calescamantes bacterium]|nr:serine hydroxymethyltransferase [Candidatus Calescamantes bacterium]
NSLEEKGLRIVAGGTDTHLMLVDLTPIDLSGKRGEKALEKAAITVNKNTIPFDPRKPFIASGIRLGTPAVTTREMGPEEMKEIASLIFRVLEDRKNPENLEAVKNDVEELCKKFPLYTGRM